MSNLHPCAGKCGEFKNGEQCMNCLINETTIQGVYAIGRINLRQDDTPMATRTVEFKKGDYVVFKYNYQPHLLMTIEAVLDGGRFVGVDGYRQAFAAKGFRHATTQEIQANKRLNHIVEPNDMGDDPLYTITCTHCSRLFEDDSDLDNTLYDAELDEYHDGCPDCKTDSWMMDITPVSKSNLISRKQFLLKNGLPYFTHNELLEIGDDTHIENHVSPNCKVEVK